MGDAPAKRAFYKSPAFRLALVYLALCAIAVLWSNGHLDHYFRLAWERWRPAPFPTHEESSLAWREYSAKGEAWRAYTAKNAAASFETSRFALCVEILRAGYRAALVALPFLAILGALARTVARARVRAGQADPLARVRAFAKKHAGLTFASPAMAWLAYTTAYYVRHDAGAHTLRAYFASFAVATPSIFLTHLLLTRLALPALLAPTIDEREKAETNEVSSDLEFAAVALTRETRLAVDGLAVLTAAMVGVLIALPTLDSIAVDVSVALYVPTAIFAAVTFRRASRIAVGSDGIHIHGSSRSRFYAWNVLDGVRSRGIDIELFRGSRTILRLQLHGRDAARREALVARINATIARAHEERDQPVTSFVNSATPDDLAHAAEGGGSYRRVAMSRDQLWAALEGPTVVSAARLAAAEALARATDPSERTRFRVAADHCAEPALRVRMRELIEEEVDSPVSAKRATLAS